MAISRPQKRSNNETFALSFVVLCGLLAATLWAAGQARDPEQRQRQGKEQAKKPAPSALEEMLAKALKRTPTSFAEAKLREAEAG